MIVPYWYVLVERAESMRRGHSDLTQVRDPPLANVTNKEYSLLTNLRN
jgi:hypothetical protein